MQRVKALAKPRSKAWIIELFKYAGVFLLFYICNVAKINTLTPFWFGLFVALVYEGMNLYILSPLYLLSCFLGDLSIYSLIAGANMVIGVVVMYVIYLHIKRKQALVMAGIGTLIGSVAYVYFGATSAVNMISVGVSLLLGLIYTFACMIIIKALNNRRFSLCLCADEYVCLGVLLAGVFCGLSYLTFFGIELSKILSVTILLVLSYIAPSFAMPAGLVVGFGIALGNGGVAYIACLAFMGLLASVFRTNSRIYSALAVIIVEILFGLYFEAFGDYSVFNAVSTLIGCLIYLALPTKLLRSISKNFNVVENSAVKNIYNQHNELLSRKLLNASEVFYEMDKVYRQFVRGTLPVEEAKKMLTAELIAGCCENCKERNKCLHIHGEQMRECVGEIFDKGFEKGKITLLDLPSFLTSRCIKTNQFVSTANALLNQYLQYTSTVKNLDNSKILIADQLSGMSKILSKIAGDMQQTLSFDKQKEHKIMEELTYKDIVCKEVAVYEQGGDSIRVSLVVRDVDSDNDNLLKVVQDTCKTKMMLESAVPSHTAGLVALDFKTAPYNELLLGLARANKNNYEFSGDSHTVTKISDSMYMIGICDGMGSGEQAAEMSDLTISLVENFYKAEFDNETILSSVNKLVALNGGDKFATLDLCIIDLRSGESDFIKLGSPEGIIKQTDTTTLVPSGALPVGMLDTATPKITKTILGKGDMIVLFSDGITDAFKDIDELSNYINNIDSLNPQVIADKILSRAIELDGGLPADDMTILVVKLF